MSDQGVLDCRDDLPTIEQRTELFDPRDEHGHRLYSGWCRRVVSGAKGTMFDQVWSAVRFKTAGIELAARVHHASGERTLAGATAARGPQTHSPVDIKEWGQKGRFRFSLPVKLSPFVLLLTNLGYAYGQPAAPEPPAASGETRLLDETFEDVRELDLESLLAAPDVESASKRKQSLEEAPGAVTVIDGDELVAAGAVTLADALRTVPGAWVYQTDANMFHVGLRGMGLMSNMSVLVLINGRRFYDLTQGYAPWSSLPVHVGEIERIEVLRGPGAPLYGADALNGVLNIVTKHAKDHSGVDAALATGLGLLPDQPGTPERQRVNNGGVGYAAVNWRRDDGTLAARAVGGFNQLGEWQDLDSKGETDVYRYGSMDYHAGVTVDWVPSAETQGWIDARHVTSEHQVSFGSTPQASEAMNEQSASLGLEKKRFLIEPLTLKIGANARRSRMEGRPITLERHIAIGRNYQATAQTDLSLFDGANIVTVGLDGALRDGRYWDGTRYQALYGAVVVQNETGLLARRLLLNVAGRFEGIRYRNNDGVSPKYVNFNPRASVILRLSSHHTLRASAATSYRTPTPFQTFVKVLPERYPDPIPPAYAVVGNPSLLPEQLRAVELGYRGRIAYWLRLDLTAFAQRATAIMQSEKGILPLQTQNSLDETEVGVELGSQIRPSPALSAYFNYSLLRATSREASQGAVRFPKHLVSLGASGKPVGALRVRGDFNYVSAVAHSVFNTGSLLKTLAHVSPQTILNLKLSHPIRLGEAQLFASGSNLLAPFKNRQELRQYSNATSAPIGTIVMIGLELGLR